MFTCNTWFVHEDELNHTKYNIVPIYHIGELYLNTLDELRRLCYDCERMSVRKLKNSLIPLNIFVGKVYIELHAYFNYACERRGKIVIMNHK